MSNAPCPSCDGLGTVEVDRCTMLGEHRSVDVNCDACNGDGWATDLLGDDIDPYEIDGSEVAL